jgi:hypothetical protein
MYMIYINQYYSSCCTTCFGPWTIIKCKQANNKYMSLLNLKVKWFKFYKTS